MNRHILQQHIVDVERAMDAAHCIPESPMAKHPADRDLRTYRIATTMCTVGLIIALFGLGFVLKQERKAAFPTARAISFGPCYIMSDDVVMCP